MYPENVPNEQSIPFISRTVLPGKMASKGIKNAFGVIPHVGVTGSFESEPYDIFMVCICLTPIQKLLYILGIYRVFKKNEFER